MNMPLERFIVNIMDELPMPDARGKVLVQHEITNIVLPFYCPVDQYAPYATKTCIENLFKTLNVDDVLEVFV